MCEKILIKVGRPADYSKETLMSIWFSGINTFICVRYKMYTHFLYFTIPPFLDSFTNLDIWVLTLQIHSCAISYQRFAL